MSTDPSTTLLHAIVDHMRGAPDDWSAIAIVVALRGGRVGGTHGFAYAADGTATPVASRPSGVDPAAQAYLASRPEHAAQPPVAMLVQLDRDAGAYEITFEDADASRWAVTPATVGTMGETLRPHLG
ncbi:hypothetical protein [Agrococcus jejuensis]|uniref:Uncharacterized protein n=1 Tax=Agrococcus jejuensis TaxID=399736 RepID=A0A1G8CNQ5_9MICO|nr:hypothetical protein [Agrococcus jejuensis]SDH47138.1 hypothetical protein SAMN04489720_1359 [Agrococcus jejuensis]